MSKQNPKTLIFRGKTYEIESSFKHENGFKYYKVTGFIGSIREDIVTFPLEPKAPTNTPKKASTAVVESIKELK